MAYNNKNLLKRIVEIQELVIEEQLRGTSLKWIYNHLIFPRYHISYSTFNNYLATNAKKKLKEQKTASEDALGSGEKKKNYTKNL